MEKYESNYDKLCIKWQQDFTTWDHEKLCEKLEGFVCEEDKIKLTYFKRPFEIDRKTGKITDLEYPERNCTFNTQMVIFHILYYSKESPVNSGVWIPFRNVKGAGPFDSAYKKIVLNPGAAFFFGKLESFIKAGEKKGFERLSYGDASFLVEVFPCTKLHFIFWDGDDEFPAQMNILFDKNITDFFHEETVVLLAEEGMSCLMEAADGSSKLTKR